MGTGVGEAMLISAITGAGTSAVTGGDPLKGALIGAATGGVGAGIAGAGTGAATGAATGSTGVAAGATDAAAQAALAQSASAPLTTGATTPLGGSGASQAGFGTSAFNPVTGMPVTPSVDPFSLGYVDPLAGSQIGAEAAGQAAQTGTPTFPRLNQFYADNPIMYPAGLGMAGAALIPPEGLDEREKYSGPLSRFSYDPDRYRRSFAGGGLADTTVARRYMKGGHLGSYSDGGRLLKGPGDGMSDDIPAKIGERQPARLADGEFVIPADVVSGLGNGSTDAGARKLYQMMDKVREARTGKKSQGKEINPGKYMPA